MTIRRSAIALLAAAVLGGCASIAAGSGPMADDAAPDQAAEELALLRLAEKVDAAAAEIPGLRLDW